MVIISVRLRYGGTPHIAEAAARHNRHRRCRWRQLAAVFAAHLRFEGAHHLIGFGQTSLLREPTRAFRQRAPDPPHKQRSMRADQHDPTPAIETEQRTRHQQERQKRHHRHRREADRLLARKRAAANLFGHEL
jgi:hypothetical protein